jgi:putative ABC transport system permease protein
MLQELRQTLRPLYRQPAASVAIVSMLALGIGLTSTMFGIVDGVLLKPLPYRNPSALVTTRAPVQAIGEWTLRTRALSAIAYYDFGLAPLVLGSDEPARLRQGAVSFNMLDTLGVVPALGRAFTRMDAESGAEPVVILTHRAWLDHFGGRSSVVGELAPFEPVRRRIIAVLPPDFMFPMRPSTAVGDARILTVIPSSRPADSVVRIVARLHDGATLDQVRAEEAGIVKSRRDEPQGVQAIDLATEILGSHRSPLSTLLGAVGLLLLIACGNVTHLLLARTFDSRRELAIRMALGARRSQVVRLVLVQGCALCLTGGLLGVALAYVGFDAFRALAPVPLPRADAAGIDARVLVFAVALSVASGLLVSLLPARQMARTDPQQAFQQGGRLTTPSQRLRHALLALEVAFAVIVLAGAGLAFNSFVRLLRVDLGFDAEQVLTLRMRGPESRYPTPAHQRVLLERALEQVAAVPGVEHAAAVDVLPVTRALSGGSLVMLDRPGLPPIDAEPRTIVGDYFATMRIEVVAGRPFDRSDAPGGLQVAIVNQALARRISERDDLLGRRVRHRDVDREIVGVVRDVRTFAVDTAAEPLIYIPHTQTAPTPSRLVVRTVGRPEQVAGQVRKALQAVAPAAPIEEVRTLSDHVATSIAHPRFQTSLLATFGLSSLLLISAGVAGIVSYTIARRTREIGVRVALGARNADVIRAVTGMPLAAVAAGLVLGLAGALALGRTARFLLYEIQPNDPWTLGAVVAAVLVTTLAAAALPARRAMRVDPVAALRAE